MNPDASSSADSFNPYAAKSVPQEAEDSTTPRDLDTPQRTPLEFYLLARSRVASVRRAANKQSMVFVAASVGALVAYGGLIAMFLYGLMSETLGRIFYGARTFEIIFTFLATMIVSLIPAATIVLLCRRFIVHARNGELNLTDLWAPLRRAPISLSLSIFGLGLGFFLGYVMMFIGGLLMTSDNWLFKLVGFGLILGGICFGLWWFLTHLLAPLLVADDTTTLSLFEAYARSSEMLKGHKGRLFALLFLLTLPFIALQFALSFVIPILVMKLFSLWLLPILSAVPMLGLAFWELPVMLASLAEFYEDRRLRHERAEQEELDVGVLV